MSERRMWLDDIREPWKYGKLGWEWVKTAEEAIAMLATGEVVEASLDHDLSEQRTCGVDDGSKTGHDVVVWMEEHGVYPRDGVWVHSLNPDGSRRMAAGLAALCLRVGGRPPFRIPATL